MVLVHFITWQESGTIMNHCCQDLTSLFPNSISDQLKVQPFQSIQVLIIFIWNINCYKPNKNTWIACSNPSRLFQKRNITTHLWSRASIYENFCRRSPHISTQWMTSGVWENFIKYIKFLLKNDADIQSSYFIRQYF